MKAFVLSILYGSIVSLVLPAQSIAQGLKGVIFPLTTASVSSAFGGRIKPIKGASSLHNGVDLPAPENSLIRALAHGTVIYASDYGEYGNFVVIKHRGGITSHYGHCNKVLVRVGERVLPGTKIGLVGATGAATGPHLHFEIRLNGVPQDPSTYLPGLWEEGRG